MENSSTESSKRDLSNSPTHHHQLKKTKIETPNDEAENPNFPEEIIVEILVRLPVKTLIKFRCVSKSWLSLISNPQFIKTQLKISSKEASSFANLRVMITICYPRFNLMQCSALSLSSPLVTYPVEVDYPKKNTNPAVWVVGSCNGLVCIAISEKDLVLWNPSTRMSYKLPPVSVKMNPGFYNIYGFGYDESTDDYKVLGIFCMFGNAGVYESLVKMYSFRTDSWKRIGDFEAGLPLDDSAKFMAGKIHLATTLALGFDFRWDIVSLDLKSEVYGTVEQPNYGEGVTEASLAVLGGSLSVLCDYERTRVDLWVLKEYGVKESWTKLVTIPYSNDPGKPFYSKPLCILPNGEMLLVLGSDFVVYNLKDNSLRRSETSNLGQFLEADMYVESLVSPTPSAGSRRQHQ